MNNLPKRKNIRLQGYDYSQNGCYFITICVKDKRQLLGHYRSKEEFVGAGPYKISSETLNHIQQKSIGNYLAIKTVFYGKLGITTTSSVTNRILKNIGTTLNTMP